MKGLTEKQQAVWDLKQEGKTHKEMGQILDISPNVVKKQLAVIHRKLGITDAHKQSTEARRIENTTPPEVQAKLLDAMSEPITKLRIAMAEAGLPEKVSETLIHRIRVKYSGVITETRNLKTNEILDMLGKKIHLGMTYLDDKVMSEASARDLMLGLGVMVEKRQLLRGEPTAIVTDLERKKLNELLPALIAESRRRGLTIEGESTVVA